VAGTISFVAGETAKHGDMKVDTPVATMGIRGTAVLVEIDFDVPQNGVPNAKFQVLVEPDGHTGNYVLYDKVTLAPIATVDQAGVVKSLSQGILTSYTSPLSADVQKLISDVFSLKFTDNTNPNTKSFDHFTDTLLPQALTPIKLADGAIAVPIIVNVSTTGSALSSGPGGPGDPHSHIPGPPTVVAPAGTGIELPNVTHSPTLDIVTGQINFFDPNLGDAPTVTTKFDSFTYQSAQHQDVTATLNALQLADIAKVEANLVLTPDPGNNNNGAVTWTYSVADSAFDFLAAGETLTLTYEARVDNNFAANDEFGLQKFTITITRGSNDVPVITTGPQTVPFSGGTTTTGGDLPATAPTSGTLAFTDVDLTDTHTVSAKLTSAVLPGIVIPPGPLAAFQAALSASIAADSTGSGGGTINWKLADLPVFLADFIPTGETLTLTYTVTVTDSQGASATQNIIVTITGTNAPAVVWIATTTPGSPAGGLWSDAANWETGTVPTLNDDVIIITDQLRGLTPSYPVTIDAPAFAKTVTMNDFGTSAPQLINQSTLTISGVLSLAADAIVDNSGTIGVGGLMEVLNTSVLQNAGLITLANGGDFLDQSKISNTITGTIDVTAGTLNVQVNIANSGIVTVESNAKLTLAAAAIDGGTVTNKGEIDLTGSAVLKNGALGNSGQINVSGAGNALDSETVTGAGFIDVTGTLTLDLGTSIIGGILTNSGLVKIETASGATLDGVSVQNIETGTIQVDDAALSYAGTLVVEDGTTITDGTLTIGSLGLFEVKTTSGATLDGVSVGNSGVVQVDADSVLNLVGGTTITDGSVTGPGTVHITGDSAIDSAKVDVSQITVDTYKTLTLDGTTVIGGTITDNGTIDIAGDSTIEGGAVLQHGGVTIESGATLTLDDVTVDGTAITGTDVTSIVHTESGQTVTLESVTITGGTLDNDGIIDSTGTSAITDVSIHNTGTIEATSGVLTIDPTVTFSNSGTIEANGGEIILSHETVTNSGTLEAVGGGLLVLDHMTVDNTDGLIEAVDPVSSSTSTIELQNTAITHGVVATVSDGIIDATGGVNTISAATINNSGTLEVTGGTLTIDAASTINNSGLFEANGGSLIVNAVLSGNAEIVGPSLLDLGGAHSTATVTFASGTSGGELELDASSFDGNIVGLAATDELDLRLIGFGPHTTGTYVRDADDNSGVLTITDGMKSISLNLTGDYSDAHFAGATDEHGGTLITLNAVDDVPVFAAVEKAQGGAVAELSNTTGSPVHDPLPALRGSIDFGDIDLTDRPTATITAQSVTWTDADQSDLSSSLNSSEISALEQALSLTQSGNTNNGAIGWGYSIADGALDFLAAGQTAKITSTVTLDDHKGGTDTATVTIVVTGTNDAPVLAVDTSGAGGSGLHAITELANKTGDSTDHDTAPGLLAFTDPDLSDTHIVSQGKPTYAWSGGVLSATQTDALTAAATLTLSETDSTHTGKGSIGFSYSAADNNFDFLAAGETLTVTYGVSVTDNHGLVSTQPVTITIIGTNDAASIGDPSSASVTDNTSVDKYGNLVATGNIPIVDADHDQSSFQTTVKAAAGDLGSLSLNADGTYTYTVANAATEYLAAGETKVDTFTVTSLDGTHKDVSFTIHGINEAPVLAADHSGANGTGLHAITERANTTGDTSDHDTASGTLAFTDPDLSDTHSVSHGMPTLAWSGGPLTTAQTNALAAATLTLSEIDSTHSGAGSIGFTYSAADGSLDFLADGQTLTVTYNVTVTDNHNVSSTQPVTITITGTNDAPVILSETNPATQAVIVLSPVTPIVLGQGVNTNGLGLNTETFDTGTSPHGLSSNNGQEFGNFYSAALDATFSGSGHAGVVNGSSSVTAAPFVGPGVADPTNYLSVGAGGTETIGFNHEQNAFGLYWGSVDSYNSISFYHGATLVASYTGADVTPLFPTGNQGSFSSNGYVEFANLASFDKVVLTSSSNAFEIDNISAGSVPAPHVELAAPITGTLTVSDADIGDTLTASVIGNAVLKYNGSPTSPGNVDISKLIASSAITFDSVKSDGGAEVLHWSYDPTNPNLDFLKSGDTLSITYTAQVNDGHGNVGSQPLTVTIAGTNTSANLSQFQVVNGTSQNDTFNVSANQTIFGAGGHDTFVFKPGFGSATIGDFDVTNDTINIDKTLVKDLSAFLMNAQPANSGLDTILTDDAQHTIKLAGVTVAQVQAHFGDFHLV